MMLWNMGHCSVGHAAVVEFSSVGNRRLSPESVKQSKTRLLRPDFEDGVAMTDEALVIQIQQGQQAVFRELMQRWQHRIFTFCVRNLGERPLAEEAAQEIFIKVYRNIQSFRNEAKFSTWIYRIAHNHCINVNARHHRRQRHQHTSLDDMEHTLSAPEPTNHLEHQDLQASIQAALDRLPEEYKSLLILRDIQDCTYEEIAEITQLNLGTIKSRIHRARKAIQPYLKGGLDK
jgi:RNA polymerase sigma-70 factor (ECF subfamily)